MENFVIIGSIGSGKSTQAELMADFYGLEHFNYSVHVKGQIKNKTELGRKAFQYTRFEKLVPDVLVVQMIEELIISNGKVKGYVFDGFPTTVEGCAALELMLKQQDLTIRNVIYLECQHQTLVERTIRKGYVEAELDMDRNKDLGQRIAEYAARSTRVKDFWQHKHEYREVNGGQDKDIIASDIRKIVAKIR